MRYYFTINDIVFKNDRDEVIKFDSYSDARHWAINHFDLSVQGLRIVDSYEYKAGE